MYSGEHLRWSTILLNILSEIATPVSIFFIVSLETSSASPNFSWLLYPAVFLFSAMRCPHAWSNSLFNWKDHSKYWRNRKMLSRNCTSLIWVFQYYGKWTVQSIRSDWRFLWKIKRNTHFKQSPLILTEHSAIASGRISENRTDHSLIIWSTGKNRATNSSSGPAEPVRHLTMPSAGATTIIWNLMLSTTIFRKSLRNTVITVVRYLVITISMIKCFSPPWVIRLKKIREQDASSITKENIGLTRWTNRQNAMRMQQISAELKEKFGISYTDIKGHISSLRAQNNRLISDITKEKKMQKNSDSLSNAA